MKLIPKYKQWTSWSLPSKATYISFLVGIIGFLITISINIYSRYLRDAENQPQLSIKYFSKPYLKYEEKDSSGLGFYFQIYIKNSGNNPATDITYDYYKQTLIINEDTVYTTHSNVISYPPPNRLVSDEQFFQIFRVKNDKLSSHQRKRCLDAYNLNEMYLLFEIKVRYEDSITKRNYNFIEKNKIFKDRVIIIND